MSGRSAANAGVPISAAMAAIPIKFFFTASQASQDASIVTRKEPNVYDLFCEISGQMTGGRPNAASSSASVSICHAIFTPDLARAILHIGAGQRAGRSTCGKGSFQGGVLRSTRSQVFFVSKHVRS